MEPTGILTVIFWLCMFMVTKVGFIGMAILIQHRMPEFIERASVHYRPKRRWWLALVGFMNAVAIPFISILLISRGALALPGILLLLVYLWLALLSYTVVYREIGSILFEDLGSNREVKITLFGGMIAEAAFFTPILGQLFSILLFTRSLGAVMMTILSRKPKDEPEDSVDP